MAPRRTERSVRQAVSPMTPVMDHLWHTCHNANMADWVAAIAAAISVAGAAFAWWREHLSKEAKTEAEAARSAAQRAENEAARHLRAIEEQAEALHRMAKVLEGPPLKAEPMVGMIWRLRNTSRNTLTITDVANRDDFLDLEGLDEQITLEPGECREVSAMSAFDSPIPSTLSVQVAGFSSTIHIPLPMH